MGLKDRPYSIVTGGNSGIGKEIAAGLMGAGHHVVLGCRNMAACEVAAAELAAAHPAGSAECSRVDLEDFDSVRAFAARHREELRRQRRPLRVLANNAGVMGPADLPDGTDRHLLANHLGPYLLTRLLLPAFPEKGPRGRVINVASRAHYWGSVSVGSGDSGGGRGKAAGGGGGGEGAVVAEARGGGGGRVLRIEGRPWWWFPKYCRSKLCNVLFTRELQRRHGPDSSATPRTPRIIAAAVSPGFVATSIFDRLPWPLPLLSAPLRAAAARTPAQGAATAVWAATAGEVTGAERDLFLHDCRPLRPSALALDPELSRALWEASAHEVGLHPDR